jgi:hypothetical protein
LGYAEYKSKVKLDSLGKILRRIVAQFFIFIAGFFYIIPFFPEFFQHVFKLKYRFDIGTLESTFILHPIGWALYFLLIYLKKHRYI